MHVDIDRSPAPIEQVLQRVGPCRLVAAHRSTTIADRGRMSCYPAGIVAHPKMIAMLADSKPWIFSQVWGHVMITDGSSGLS